MSRIQEDQKKKPPGSVKTVVITPTTTPRKKWSKLTWSGIGTAALVLIAAAIFIFYYFWIPANTLVVIPEPFPSNFSPGFSENQLADYLLTSLEKVQHDAESSTAAKKQSPSANLGIQTASADAPYMSWRVSLPVFDQKVHGIAINTLRQWALSLKAYRFLHLDAIKTDDKNRFRLFARLKGRFDSTDLDSWKVPDPPDSCQAPEICTFAMAEAMLQFLDPHMLVLFYMKQNNKTAFDKVINLYTSNAIPPDKMQLSDYYAWGDALRNINENDQAIIKYRKALNFDPTFCSVHDIIGTTYLRKSAIERQTKSLDDAEQEYRQALQCNPSDAVAHCDLGYTLIQKWKIGHLQNEGLMNEAIREGQEALKYDPGLAEAAVNIGYVQYWHGPPQAALDYFQCIAARFSTSATLYLNFGFILWREYVNGRAELLQPAIDNTRRAWKWDQTSEIAAGNLGYFYYEAQLLDQANEYWKKAYDLNQTSPDILLGSALGLFKADQIEEAIKRYREAVRRDPQIRDPEHLRKAYFLTPMALHDAIALGALALPATDNAQ